MPSEQCIEISFHVRQLEFAGLEKLQYTNETIFPTYGEIIINKSLVTSKHKTSESMIKIIDTFQILIVIL